MSDDLDPDQYQAFEGIDKFRRDEQAAIYTLHGLAGCGKTYTLATVAREFDLPICAPTGKAASILRQKHDLPARTIHQEFFRLKDTRQRDRDPVSDRWRHTSKGDLHPVFSQSLADKDEDLVFVPANNKIAIVALDECSMIGSRIATELLDLGVKIVAVGDPGQLPPVEDVPYFTDPSFSLNKIHRQAEGNPIIRQAHAIRHGQNYRPDGPLFRVQDKILARDVEDADVVICWRRATRDSLTDILRGVKGTRDFCPQAGEPVICLKNNYRHNIFNGQTGVLLEPFEPGNTTIHLTIDGERKSIPETQFMGMPYGAKGKQPANSFDFAYAMSIHKAQGSEWRSIIVIDEMPRHHHDWKALMYTGVTRAQEKCLIIPR